ncbi:MAG: alpha-amylase, partial [Lachnospiraceae bacterium]|nr:alpha-amylase [Lachnospiraceae bacterium]
DEFDVDGIRLDAADVLDFEFMKALRAVANQVKPDFWLMGEVIHGDYTRWVNEGTLHSVTNYNLHKALYSGHNDHNYFEIAHTVKRLYDMGGNRPDGLKLYNFVDNHDVERIYTKLNNKAHFAPVHILLYTLPGVPSIYYGSEFAIEGKKENYSDDSLRPALKLSDFSDALDNNPATRLIAALGAIRRDNPVLSYGEYCERMLTNRQYAFSRKSGSDYALIAVNNDDGDFGASLPVEGGGTYIGLLSGTRALVKDGRIDITIKANSGDIWVPAEKAGGEDYTVETKAPEPVVITEPAPQQTAQPEAKQAETTEVSQAQPEAGQVEKEAESQAEPQTQEEHKLQEAQPQPEAVRESSVQTMTYEEGIIRGLQEAILARMEKNGPVTDQMRRDVENNVYHDSLINWIKSF